MVFCVVSEKPGGIVVEDLIVRGPWFSTYLVSLS